MEQQKTERGFDRFTFTDQYDKACHLQKSSLATEDCVWLGLDKAEPMIQKSQILPNGAGVETIWEKYPLSDRVHISTAMHLTREQVKALLPVLQKFVETGELT
jgi:hypothetical protein